MTTELVSNLPAEFSRAGAVIDAQFPGCKRAVYERVKVYKTGSPEWHLASPILPLIMGITNFIIYFSLTACASARMNFYMLPP